MNPRPATAATTLDVIWPDLALVAMLVLVAIALSRWQRLGLERGFFVGALRAVVQLVAVGYVLVYLFEATRWWLVLLALAVMLVAATSTATRRRRGQTTGAGERRAL
jgi:putative ABC transport system permease protein